MEDPFPSIVEGCRAALDAPDPQSRVAEVLLEAAKNPAVATVVAGRTELSSLEDLAIHRSERLTLVAGAVPPGFVAGPHNHNPWSVVAVCWP